MFEADFGDMEAIAPQPLDIRGAMGDAAEFPIEAMTPMLRAAIEAIAGIVKVPLSLAAQSVLSAVALGAQGYVNVENLVGQSVPVSLFFVTIATSGDRKSTADKMALKPIKDREEQMAIDYEVEKTRYSIDEAAHAAAVRNAKTGKKSRADIVTALSEAGPSPVPPALPLMTCSDPTGPALMRAFAEALPAIGLYSDEGATFIGGWSMQEDNQAATGAILSQLWDGSPIKRLRSGQEGGTQILYGRRLSLHLMCQPDIANKLLGNAAVRNQGLLSRILVAFPKSLKGTRIYSEPTADQIDALAKYHQRLAQTIAPAFAYRNNDIKARALDLQLVRLSPEAKALMIKFSNHIEQQIGPNGKYSEISDFASKMPENAIRLGAALSFFQRPSQLVQDGLSELAAKAGIALMEFYASEAMRLYGNAAIDDETANAAILIDWIRKRGFDAIGVRYLNRRGPTQVRSARALKRAIEILVETCHLTKIPAGASLDLDGAGKKTFYREAYTVIEVTD